jgi:hypothetical protein
MKKIGKDFADILISHNWSDLISCRYGAVIRGPDAYVPPGARKTSIDRLNSASPGTPAVIPQPRTAQPSVARRPSPAIDRSPASSIPQINIGEQMPLVDDFRQFVSKEKERLTQKRQDLVTVAAKKEQTSRTASLMAFSQNFKVRLLCLSREV